jgi:hypothetical protein
MTDPAEPSEHLEQARVTTMRSMIASAIYVAGEGVKPAVQADAVLAMPEMQAIRNALLHAAFNAARHAYPAAGIDPTRTYLTNECKLSDTLADWVLS